MRIIAYIFLFIDLSAYGQVATKGNQLPLSGKELAAIREGFNTRVAASFCELKDTPLLRDSIRAPLNAGRPGYSRAYSMSLVLYATKCFWLNEHTDSASDALLENAHYFLNDPKRICDRDNFRWDAEMLFRLIELFGRHGTRHKGLLSEDAENEIMEMGWLYCKRDPSVQSQYSNLSAPDHRISGTWYITESENHHVQDFITLWHFAKLAKDNAGFCDRVYYDGNKASFHYRQWQEYMKIYFTERAKKGLLIEMMSYYNAELLKGIFNVYDFEEDPEVKRKSGLFLDLYFAYWAQEQLNGISGGGKARIYNDNAPRASAYGYFFFGIGKPPKIACIMLSAMTSSYRPPDVVTDIAVDIAGRGIYEVSQRPLGLAAKGYNAPVQYRMRTDSGGILRYSFCTPDFIMGTVMSEARPADDWSMISIQNRSQGVCFAGNDNACILPQCEKLNCTAAFNTQWSVQKKGTLICQKLTYSKLAGKMEVWFSREGLTIAGEEGGWIFAEAKGAYAAVRVMDGKTRWMNSTAGAKGKWLLCENDYSPVILETAQRSLFRSFNQFRDSILSRPLAFKDRVVHYKGMYGDEFTFFTDYSGVPQINGLPVNYAPSKAFESPFLRSEWNSGIVYIQKEKRSIVLDFN